MMNFIIALGLLMFVNGQEIPSELDVEPGNNVETVDNSLTNTDLILAFVVFRHGDRTPDHEELEMFPTDEKNKNVFFPHGMKALTNKGKQCGFRVGEYLRRRYDGFISRLYLPDEISVRTTDYARTKMTALTALAAMYLPLPPQKWNPALDWQPIPYDTPAYDDDDILYWYNCPRYLWLRNKMYDLPEFKKQVKPYQGLFKMLSEKIGTNFTQPDHVFFLDNLFQTLENVGIKTPKWIQEIMPQIKEVTKIEFATEFYNSELIRLAAGPLMAEIINETSLAIAGRREQPKLKLYSAHENNVAALMAATKVFQPHQPGYGATFALELRRNRYTGQFGIAAIYSPDAGRTENILQVAGCGGQDLCDYDTFLNLVQNHVWSQEEFRKECPRLS